MTSRDQMPHLLALEVSSNACSIALLARGQSFPEAAYQTHIVAPMQQAKLILPEIQKLLNQASIAITDLGAIAYGCGPGSFTGLRLACSIVQALGFRVDIPVLPVSSLAVWAQTVYLESGWERVIVALNARKGMVYWAPYQLGDEGVMLPTEPEKLISVDEMTVTDYPDWYFAGDGWDKQIDRLSSVSAPSAMAIIPMATLKWGQNGWISPADAIPVYLDPYKS